VAVVRDTKVVNLKMKITLLIIMPDFKKEILKTTNKVRNTGVIAPSQLKSTLLIVLLCFSKRNKKNGKITIKVREKVVWNIALKLVCKDLRKKFEETRKRIKLPNNKLINTHIVFFTFHLLNMVLIIP